MKKQDLISDFDALLGPPIADDIPDGFFSVDQIAERKGMAAKSIYPKLEKLAKEGKCDRRKFKNESGRVCWFYRVKAEQRK